MKLSHYISDVDGPHGRDSDDERWQRYTQGGQSNHLVFKTF